MNILLEAVAYDLQGSESRVGNYKYDCEDIRELCGCLITIPEIPDPEFSGVMESRSPQDSGSVDSSENSPDGAQVGESTFFVSLAHYSVLEFLQSRQIRQSRINYFTLLDGVVLQNFAASVLKQALDAGPTGGSADWVNDREVYCLHPRLRLGRRNLRP